MTQTARKLRILAFGDSLTQGETYNSTTYLPYTTRLRELMEKNGFGCFDLDNAGITGEFVRDELINRLPGILEKQGPYDLVVILGGTNDLSTHKTGDEEALYKGIVQLHELSLKHGAKTLLLTMPESDFFYKDLAATGTSYVKEEGEKGRVTVNEMLREFARKCEGVYLCDIEKAIPQRSLNEEKLDLYWDDGLHFTPEGYNKMAEVIFDTIKQVNWD
ncbi:predicted protein [Nematostella vectensis]|uniref:SGNH hydrolase-type esterase domain-containing protein n=1 Tax=Nematostella vectensis TaxID=45351 RepID=A7SDI5_NEMVE|nr:predicted protein [Nematostella vectensis]|eukprot:XP_001630329.1 predicted protein [Nematostella vectensis]